jgi:hypothetical protein
LGAHAYAVEPTESIPETSHAERVTADLHTIGALPVEAERVRDSVPLWFHTFAPAPGIYTPGIARDHGYRLAVLGADRFAGRACLTSARSTASTVSSRSSAARGACSRSTTSSTSTGSTVGSA